jgi:hypothetical protein
MDMAKNEDEPKAPSGWDKIMGGARTADEWSKAAVEDRSASSGWDPDKSAPRDANGFTALERLDMANQAELHYAKEELRDWGAKSRGDAETQRAAEDRPKVVARDLGADIERKVEEIGEKLRDARREPGLEQQVAALKDRQRGRDGRGDEGRGR